MQGRRWQRPVGYARVRDRLCEGKGLTAPIQRTAARVRGTGYVNAKDWVHKREGGYVNARDWLRERKGLAT